MGEAKKRVQAQVHAVPTDDQIRAIPSSKVPKIYPASDSEELFYGDGKAGDARRRRRASCDSLSTTGSGNSRRSSIADGTVGQSVAQDPRKTLVVLIGSRTPSSLVQKQRSWETFPRPKSKRGAGGEGPGGGASSLGQLKKADSFEGHEEAVRTLVAAVQETRSQLRHHHLHHHRHHRKSKTN